VVVGTGTVAVLGWDVEPQLVFTGAVTGLGYAVIAAGIVLIYRSSGVINFAQAEFGALGAFVFTLLTNTHGLPYGIAFAVGIAAGVLIAVVVELVVVRRLFEASRVTLLIATLGVAQLVVALIISIPRPRPGPIPTAFSGDWAAFSLFGDEINVLPRDTSVILLVAPVLVALGWFLTRTRFGLRIRAVADSADTARLVGVSPRRVSTIVWGIAGGFAAFTAIVLAPITAGTVQGLSATASPGLLLRALAIGLFARMASIPLVVVGGVALGVLETLVQINVVQVGIFDLFLLVIVLVLVLFRARAGRADDAAFSVGVQRTPVPERLLRIWWIRHMPRLALAALFGLGALVPVFVTKPSALLTWSTMLLFAAVAVSISVLTGWAGQLSLGQFAFVGVGGLATIALHRGHDIGVGGPIVGELFTFSVELPWGFAILGGTLVGVAMAVVIGLPALRVRGLFLAVTTLAFAIACATWLFRQDAWTGGSTTVGRQPRPVLGSIETASPRTYYFLCLGFLALVAVAVGHLRRTGIGRAMIAVRDNEPMTAAATVSPTRAKLSAFAIAGGIAALAGGLYVYLVPGFVAAGLEGTFRAGESLRVVAMAIIGGLGSVAGGILGALWVIGLPAAFGNGDRVLLLTSGIGLLVLIMYFPGGLVQLCYSARDALLRAVERRLGPEVRADARAAIVREVPTRARHAAPPGDRPWLITREVTVRYGGLLAVDGVSLDVRPREIVGLIGTNGAGKSTLMNAIGGFARASGKVEILGRDASHLPAARRARLGMGRGFQAAALFPGLTVRETVLVALEARERSLLLPSLFALPPSPGSERRKRAEAEEIIDFFGLGRYGDTFVSNLSTGTRRIVELACLVAIDAKVLLLDEPTGGVAQRETEAFAPLIVRVRQELDASVLLIEHDMPLVMSISDRVYCLEAGAIIAEGTPAQVRADPRVIASYLGTDERAILRSGAAATGMASRSDH
jgi:ABC-type branched-subunit amino acid transport system ATPase component/ABC-type branched-subunit amino acid transport system permease subunit